MYTIRKGEVRDIPALHNIINYYITHTTYSYALAEQDYRTTEKWFCAMNTGKFDLYVLECDGAVVGYASYGTFRQKAAYAPTVEHSIYLMPGHEKGGWGRKLLETIIASAKQKGYWTMVAVIDGSNENSVQFHEHMGFTMVGTMVNVAQKFDRALSIVYLQYALNEPDPKGADHDPQPVV